MVHCGLRVRLGCKRPVANDPRQMFGTINRVRFFTIRHRVEVQWKTLQPALHCHGMLIAALLVGLINPLSSASLVSFHLALPCLILVVEAVRRLHFTWLRLSRHRRGQLPDAHLAMPNQDAGSGVDRRRHALFGPRRRFGDILAWDSFFHLGHKDQGRCLAFLPCTPRQALF